VTSLPQLHAQGGAITFNLPSVVRDFTCFLDLSFARSNSVDSATYSIADAATGTILASVYLPPWTEYVGPTSNVVLPLAGLTTPAVKFSWKSANSRSPDALWLSPFMTVRMAFGAPDPTTTRTRTRTVTATTTSTIAQFVIVNTAVKIRVFWILACGLAVGSLQNF
jgi:hypothetical protein